MTRSRTRAWHPIAGPVIWMTAAGFASWVAAMAVTGFRIHPEALLGVLGPLVIANASWLLMTRTFAAGPERLTGVIVQLLAIKLVLFGVYVTVLLGVLDLRPVPFVLSFAGTFVALHAMEALFLRRLLMDGARPPVRPAR